MREDGEHAEGPAPVQGRAEPRTERRPHCQSDRGAKGRDRQGPAGMFRSGDASGVAGEHAPQQAGECTGKEPRSQGEHDVRGERRDEVRGQEAEDPDNENGLPAHAPRHGDRGHRRNDCSEGVGADELPGGALGDVQPRGDLRQQAGGHGFGGNQEESHQGHDQQRCPGKASGLDGKIALLRRSLRVLKGADVFVRQAVDGRSAGVILKGCASQNGSVLCVGSLGAGVPAQSPRASVAVKPPRAVPYRREVVERSDPHDSGEVPDVLVIEDEGLVRRVVADGQWICVIAGRHAVEGKRFR